MAKIVLISILVIFALWNTVWAVIGIVQGINCGLDSDDTTDVLRWVFLTILLWSCMFMFIL